MDALQQHPNRIIRPGNPLPQKVGVVLIDMQHPFSGSEIAWARAPGARVYQNACKLLSFASENGLPIALVRYTGGELARYPVNPVLVEFAGKKAEIIEKHTYDANDSEAFRAFLEKNSLDAYVLGGYSMPCCPFYTLKSTLEAGRQSVITSADILLSRNPDEGAPAIRKFFEQNTTHLKSVFELVEHVKKILKRAASS